VKAPELRELPDEELLSQLESQKEELFNLRFQAATGQLDNSMRIKQVRHDIARIMTVLRGRQTEEELTQAVAAADRESLEERREAIARGELKGRSLTEMAEESLIEQEAAAGAEAVPEGVEEDEGDAHEPASR
jgi:large subunit ribosomal protein L29